MQSEKLKPCPCCKESWLYSSTGDYSSGYESLGYRVNCKCGYAWFNTKFCKTKREAMESWNRRIKDGKERNDKSTN